MLLLDGSLVQIWLTSFEWGPEGQMGAHLGQSRGLGHTFSLGPVSSAAHKPEVARI